MNTNYNKNLFPQIERTVPAAVATLGWMDDVHLRFLAKYPYHTYTDTCYNPTNKVL